MTEQGRGQKRDTQRKIGHGRDTERRVTRTLADPEDTLLNEDALEDDDLEGTEPGQIESPGEDEAGGESDAPALAREEDGVEPEDETYPSVFGETYEQNASDASDASDAEDGERQKPTAKAEIEVFWVVLPGGARRLQIGAAGAGLALYRKTTHQLGTFERRRILCQTVAHLQKRDEAALLRAEPVPMTQASLADDLGIAPSLLSEAFGRAWLRLPDRETPVRLKELFHAEPAGTAATKTIEQGQETDRKILRWLLRELAAGRPVSKVTDAQIAERLAQGKSGVQTARKRLGLRAAKSPRTTSPRGETSAFADQFDFTQPEANPERLRAVLETLMEGSGLTERMRDIIDDWLTAVEEIG